MNDRLITLDGADGHTLVVGTTAKGKSRLHEEQAARLGATVEQLESCMQPDSDTLARAHACRAAARLTDAVRLDAVRTAYWQATPEDDCDIETLRDAVVASGLSEAPTRSQLYAVFMTLPSAVIGAGITWGFSDSVVRDDVYEFVSENRQLLQRHFAA